MVLKIIVASDPDPWYRIIIMPATTPATETLSDILDQWAKRDQLSDEQIGNALGYSGPAVGHWRNQRSVPNAKVWGAIARMTGRTVEEIACAIARGVQRVPARRASATVASRSRK